MDIISKYYYKYSGVYLSILSIFILACIVGIMYEIFIKEIIQPFLDTILFFKG